MYRTMYSQLQIQINGTTRSVQNGTNLSDLIQILALSDRKIAVEVNQEIIPQSQHDQTQLCDGDRIEIIDAIGGG